MDNADREADLAAIQAVKSGDATAYRGLVSKYDGRIYAMIFGMVRNREDARDLTQEAFVKAYNNLDLFRLDSSFYTWIYRIAMNVTIDFVSKRKDRGGSSPEEALPSDGIDGASHVDRQRLLNRIQTAIDQLSPEHRQAILLRELEGLSYKEIAEIMEIPEGTVMSMLFHARKRLQKILAESPP